jgi:hypothetical protein
LNKIVLDEGVPEEIALHLPGHEVRSVRQLWRVWLVKPLLSRARRWLGRLYLYRKQAISVRQFLQVGTSRHAPEKPKHTGQARDSSQCGLSEFLEERWLIYNRGKLAGLEQYSNGFSGIERHFQFQACQTVRMRP